jgi:hypothetical protein
MTSELTTQEQERIKEETHSLVVQAQGLVIKTEMDNTKAAQLTAAYKAEIKKRKASELYTKTEEAKKAAASAFKALTELMIDPLTDSVDIITEKIGIFYKEETARRAQLQAIEDAKVAKAQRKEDERIAKITAKAEAAGKVAPVIEPKIIAARVIAAVSAPGGTTYRDNWSAKVTDIKALCAAVVAGAVDVSYVQGNDVALNSWAKLKKVEGEIFPGVIGVKTITTSQRTY